MVILALTLLTTQLSLIFTPFPLWFTAGGILSLISLLLVIAIRWQRPTYLLIALGGIISLLTTFPTLIQYSKALNHLPYNALFEVKILSNNLNYRGVKGEIRAIVGAEKRQRSPLIGKQITLYEIPHEWRHSFHLGATYQIPLRLKRATHAPTPIDTQRAVRALAKNEIGNATYDYRLGEIRFAAPPNYIDRVRNRLYHTFHNSHHPARAYFSALTIGVTDHITQKEWDILRKTGTVHLISISGLHLSLVAFWGFLLLRTLFGLLQIYSIPPFRLAALFSLIIAVTYALLAGFSLPTQRALWMFTTAMVALLLYRRIFSLQSLAVALTLILIINPLASLTIGFWLSFVAVTLLILLRPSEQRHFRWLLYTQGAVSLILMPLSAAFFGEISLISPIANLIAIPWTTFFILPPLLIATVLLPLSSRAANALLSFTDHTLQVMLQTLTKIADLPFSALSLPPPPFWLMLTITILGLLYFHRRNWVTLSVALLILAITPLINSKTLSTRADHLLLFPVGEGLALYIESGQQTLLYDTGPYFRGYSAAKRIILPTLERYTRQPLTYLLLSRQNQHHTGGVADIRRRYPQAIVAAPKEIQFYIDGAHHCHSYNIENSRFTLTPLPYIKSSCAFEVTFLKSDKILWLIGDITPLEWSLLVKNRPLPHLLLFPNQGRSRHFDPTLLLQRAKEQRPILLFSTQQIAERYHPLLTQIPSANSYDGWVKITLPANPKKSINVESYRNQERYWWFPPLH